MDIYSDQSHRDAPVARDENVKLLARVEADVSHIPEDKLARREGNDGQSYYELSCKIEAMYLSASTTYTLIYNSEPSSPLNRIMIAHTDLFVCRPAVQHRYLRIRVRHTEEVRETLLLPAFRGFWSCIAYNATFLSSGVFTHPSMYFLLTKSSRTINSSSSTYSFLPCRSAKSTNLAPANHDIARERVWKGDQDMVGTQSAPQAIILGLLL